MKILNLELLRNFLFFLLLVISYMPKDANASNINSKIIICGVCKNIAPFLQNTIDSIESFQKHFIDYRVIIYENNSTDNTAELLKTWERQNPKVQVISEYFTKDELKTLSVIRTLSDSQPCRMELIARARNQTLQRAFSTEFDDYDYVMMIDMDISNKWDINGILSSFKLNTPWDAILANGIHQNGVMRDYYAWRDAKYIPLGPELTGEVFWKKLPYLQLNFPRNHPLIPVYSAFGGIGIYKRNSIKQLFYDALPSQELKSLYNQIITITTRFNKETLYYIKRINHKSENIKFINNSGYDQPVVCEHVIFHSKMIANGFDKIYVNPNMVFYY